MRLWLLVLGFTFSAHAAVRDVTTFGAVPNDGTSDSAAIAAAVAASQAGDTVFFPAGTYLTDDAIRPHSGTSLVGAGRDATIVRYVGTALLPLVELEGQSDVEVAALTLDGGANANAENGIHGANGSGHRLHDLTIRDLVQGAGFGPHGIYFSTAVTDSEIRDNLITDMAPGSQWGAGMRISQGSSRNVVMRNVIAVTGRGGVLNDNGSVDLVIRDNVITGSGVGLGIELFRGCDRAIVEDNAIDHWLSLDTSSYCAVRRNIVSDTTGTIKIIGLDVADVFVPDGAPLPRVRPTQVGDQRPRAP